MEGVSGLLTKVAEGNRRDRLGRVWFHGLHYQGPLSFETAVPRTMGVAVTNVIELRALILHMTTFPIALAGITKVLLFPVMPGSRSSPIKSSLDFLGILVQLNPSTTPGLVP
ncbi:hypothetical protein R1flu_026126 [Riccia fluitans]|uniref:Uncharacterized protein n=1 Tax=Riccia fluitans TaxID=41844 RepID=A0ABD1XF35_9MARC